MQNTKNIRYANLARVAEVLGVPEDQALQAAIGHTDRFEDMYEDGYTPLVRIIAARMDYEEGIVMVDVEHIPDLLEKALDVWDFVRTRVGSDEIDVEKEALIGGKTRYTLCISKGVHPISTREFGKIEDLENVLKEEYQGFDLKWEPVDTE